MLIGETHRKYPFHSIDEKHWIDLIVPRWEQPAVQLARTQDHSSSEIIIESRYYLLIWSLPISREAAAAADLIQIVI